MEGLVRRRTRVRQKRADRSLVHPRLRGRATAARVAALRIPPRELARLRGSRPGADRSGAAQSPGRIRAHSAECRLLPLEQVDRRGAPRGQLGPREERVRKLARRRERSVQGEPLLLSPRRGSSSGDYGLFSITALPFRCCRWLSESIFIVFPSAETVIVSTSTTFPARLSVSTMVLAPFFFKETMVPPGSL